MPFQYSFVPTDTACLPSAPLLFRRPPPGLHPPPGFRRPSGSGPGSTAHTHRNKQNLAACRRPTTRPHPASLPPRKNPTLAPLQPLTCTARSPPETIPGGRAESGGAWEWRGWGQGDGRGFPFFPASPPRKGWNGLEWRVLQGWGLVGGVSSQLGSGDRGVTVRWPPGSVCTRTLSPSPCCPSPAAPSALPRLPGAGGILFQRAGGLREATGERRRGGGPAPARTRRQLLLRAFPRLRVGRERDKHGGRASASPR